MLVCDWLLLKRIQVILGFLDALLWLDYKMLTCSHNSHLLSTESTIQRISLLTLIMLGFLENAKNCEIQYLCYGDKCWYLCRAITATLKKYIICSSHDLIFINLHMIKNANFLLMYWSNITLKIKSWGSPDNLDIKIIKIGSLSNEMWDFKVYEYVLS